jgi:hypothetical protein
LGTWYSLSPRWRARDGEPSAAASEVLATLEPRFAARLSALACAPVDRAAELTADLSTGAFDAKWGALPAALWLETEVSRSDGAVREFVLAGPEGIWELAARRLSPPLGAVVEEARLAGALCGSP